MKLINAIRMGGMRGPAAGRGRQGRLHLQRRSAPAPGRRPAASARSARVNADSYDEKGEPIPQVYHGRTRRERHEELIEYAIDGARRAGPARLRDRRRQGRASTSTCCGRWAAPSASSRRARAHQGPRSTASPAAPACPTSCPRSPRATASTTSRSSARRAPSARCGSAPITRPPNGSAASSTRIRGWPAATTASPTARTRASRRTRIRACWRCARRCASSASTRRRSSWPAASGGCDEWERLDRQSRARADRLPVRHAAAADPGKPDPATRGRHGC